MCQEFFCFLLIHSLQQKKNNFTTLLYNNLLDSNSLMIFFGTRKQNSGKDNILKNARILKYFCLYSLDDKINWKGGFNE